MKYESSSQKHQRESALHDKDESSSTEDSDDDYEEEGAGALVKIKPLKKPKRAK